MHVHAAMRLCGNLRSDPDDVIVNCAQFCKHVFVPNFVSAKLNALKIEESNVSRLHSGYTQRRPEELAVLARYVPSQCCHCCTVCTIAMLPLLHGTSHPTVATVALYTQLLCAVAPQR